MLDIDNGTRLSGLSEDDYTDIIWNYSKYSKEFLGKWTTTKLKTLYFSQDVFYKKGEHMLTFYFLDVDFLPPDKIV